MIEQLVQQFHLPTLFIVIRFYADLFGFQHILTLIPVKDKRIIAVKAVVFITRIFGTFKAILQTTVPYTARSHSADSGARTVLEASAAAPLKAVSAQSAVQPAER